MHGNAFFIQYPEENFHLNLRNRFFNFISSIRSENTFRTTKNLFDFKKSPFQPFSNELKKTFI